MDANIVLKSIRKGYSKKPEVFTIGGYEFIVDGNHICFDWNMMVGNASIDYQGEIQIEVEQSDFATDVFGKEYEQMEIDITAELLSRVEEIEEIYYECYEDEDQKAFIPLEVVSIKIDGLEIDRNVLENYARKNYKAFA